MVVGNGHGLLLSLQLTHCCLLVPHEPEPTQKLLLCLGEVTAFLFSAVILTYGGIQITNLAMGQMTSSLGVPIGIFYIVLPLCGLLNMVYTALNIIDIIKQKEEAA